ncbi:glutamate--cysteine ligase regulatory subunit [Venturia canescens]|uniref:glutamate--cysteine ligase regulatory subunit n=1 Tax=Venturia canescens TaxID=32260 RepID=UPI001C9CF880|nr:glutamate--cysteine ligase regulatory subunit [Venturia canescens]
MASRNLLVNTGNILSLSDLKRKAGQNPSEELIEALKITLNEPRSKYDTLNTISCNENLSLTDIERNELKISVKVFIPQANKKALGEALDQVLTSLDAGSLESVVISYDTIGKTPEDILSALKQLWPVLEHYVQEGTISGAGVSDVDTDVFVQLHEWAADVKPNIVQINLASCCVVPPALQEFTKKNFIQLLTHSDPCQLLPPEAISEVFGPETTLSWVARYQVHVKCRGVLASKGYLVSLRKEKLTSG